MCSSQCSCVRYESSSRSTHCMAGSNRKPKRLHLGHYKALIAKHQYTDVQDKEGGEEETEDELVELRAKWNHMQQTML